jgi:hypothetical protein
MSKQKPRGRLRHLSNRPREIAAIRTKTVSVVDKNYIGRCFDAPRRVAVTLPLLSIEEADHGPIR